MPRYYYVLVPVLTVLLGVAVGFGTTALLGSLLELESPPQSFVGEIALEIHENRVLFGTLLGGCLISLALIMPKALTEEIWTRFHKQ